MKTILVDAVDTFIVEENEKFLIFQDMYKLLETYPNQKIILTGANDDRYKKFGLDKMPYPVFTLKHNPEKTDPEYFKKMLENFGLKNDEVVYFEHNLEAVRSAESVGIKSYFYDKDTKNLESLKRFLDENSDIAPNKKTYNDKEFSKNYVRYIAILWLSFVGISPYFLVALAISSVDIDSGFKIYDTIFNFVSFSIFPIILLVLFRKKLPPPNPIKEFIAQNIGKVFFIGVALFYIITIWMIFKDSSNIIGIIFNLLMSFVAFPVLFGFLIIGKKFSKKIENITDSSI